MIKCFNSLQTIYCNASLQYNKDIRGITMLNKRLIHLRKQKNMTQEQVSKIIGVTRPAYTAYEKGSRTPDYDILQSLADYYDVSIDYLLGRTDNPTPIDRKDEKEFFKAISDPDLERWYAELPQSEEEDLKRLRKMWEIIKSDSDRK